MKLDPDYTGAYYIRGMAYGKSDQIENSIRDFTTVLEIDPTHVNAAFARAAWENKIGNFLKAIEDYNMALKLDSERGKFGFVKRTINGNLGMSYVIPTSNEQFLSASKVKPKNRNDSKSIDLSSYNNDKQEGNLDLISTGGTNSFIEAGENTPSVLGQVTDLFYTKFALYRR